MKETRSRAAAVKVLRENEQRAWQNEGRVPCDTSLIWVSGACISSISVLCGVVHWDRHGPDPCSLRLLGTCHRSPLEICCFGIENSDLEEERVSEFCYLFMY